MVCEFLYMCNDDMTRMGWLPKYVAPNECMCAIEIDQIASCVLTSGLQSLYI